MKWQEGREGEVEDRRGMRRVHAVGGGGIGLVIIALIGYFVFDIDPQKIMSMADSSQIESNQDNPSLPNSTKPQDEAGKFTNIVHTSANDIWTQVFQEQGVSYRASHIVTYSQGTQTGCGEGQAAMGPFYCPNDEKVYIDLDFFNTLETQLGAKGDFAKAYVIGHEVGHHVQKQMGITQKVSARQSRMNEREANALSVKLELQADCFAGIWAKKSNEQHHWLEAGDIEEALGAASSVGDDTLQKAATGRVMPDSFTHGSSTQRMQWFSQGFTTGNVEACDSFA